MTSSGDPSSAPEWSACPPYYFEDLGCHLRRHNSFYQSLCFSLKLKFRIEYVDLNRAILKLVVTRISTEDNDYDKGLDSENSVSRRQSDYNHSEVSRGGDIFCEFFNSIFQFLEN